MSLSNVQSGATKVTKVLTALNQEVTIWCEGQSKVGINIRSVTGTVVLTFLGSMDGLVYNPLSVGAYPSASPPVTNVLTAAAVGDYEVPVQNYKFIRVKMTTGAGPVSITLAASVDGSYQEAFDDTTAGVSLSGVLYPSTTSSSGVNTMTIPAVGNATINLTFLEVAMTGPGGGGAQLRIWDGSVGNGVPLYSCYLIVPAGSVGAVQNINLPEDAQRNVGLQGTPGNALVIQIVNLGSVSAIMNARRSFL